jgi:hypothetical protein
MLYAKGSHKLHHKNITEADRNYSDDEVRQNFEILKCIGKKGSIIIFDPNGIHKLQMIPNASRMHLHLNFTLGNDIAHSESYVTPLKTVTHEGFQLNKIQEESLTLFHAGLSN